MVTSDKLYQLKVELWNSNYSLWKTQTLFSIHWWGLVALIVLSYAIWLVIVDRPRLSQILLFGSLVAVQRVMMDIVGSNMVLWSYDIGETPFSPSPFLHDFTLTPLALMVVYQYCHSWKKFIVWTVVATGIISFVFFPILMTLGFLKLYHWKLYYSFVLIVGIASLSRGVVLGILNIEQKYK